jgi:hypothetical protein
MMSAIHATTCKHLVHWTVSVKDLPSHVLTTTGVSAAKTMLHVAITQDERAAAKAHALRSSEIMMAVEARYLNVVKYGAGVCFSCCGQSINTDFCLNLTCDSFE